MGIANDTIVVYSSDNGPHMNSWPDGAMTWFRSEKNTNWEGAFRVPCLVRWPGVIKPGTVTNELMSHNDWIPTLCAIAGEPDIVNKLKAGYTANGINYKVHLDGYDQSAFLRNVSGTAANNNGTKSARDKFFYSDDDGLLVGLRKGDYKYVFAEQRKAGTMGVWAEPFTTLRLQKIFNLMQDPFERADITSNTFWDWQINHVGQRLRRDGRGRSQFVATFKEFPPRSFPPSFNPANIMESTLDGIKEEGADGRTGRRPHSRPAEPDDGSAVSGTQHPVERRRKIAHDRETLANVRSIHASRPEFPDACRSSLLPAHPQGARAGRQPRLACRHAQARTDPLPSWNDGATKTVHHSISSPRVTTRGGAGFRPADRAHRHLRQ